MSKSTLWPYQLGSSDVDWCESNFQITAFVAEFWNTVSNALFFILPPVLVYLFRQYAERVTRGVNVVWALLAVVGMGSVYFHATLSLIGQLLDEIAIIWVFMAALSLWYPKRFMPAFMDQKRIVFQKWIGACAILTTGLACVMPAINCIVLLLLGVPATILLILQIRDADCPRVKSLGFRCLITWVLALTSWVTDSLFCHAWQAINFPYMHCLWHIFIALASYQCCVLFAYFDAKAEVPNQKPKLSFWPQDRIGLFGVPYIYFGVSADKLTKVL